MLISCLIYLRSGRRDTQTQLMLVQFLSFLKDEDDDDDGNDAGDEEKAKYFAYPREIV